MTKQELAHIARLMYDLQEECKSRDYCPNCPASISENGYHKRCYFGEKEPQMWEITKADIKRLDGESNALDRYEDCDTNGELNNGAYRTWLAKRLGDSDDRE